MNVGDKVMLPRERTLSLGEVKSVLKSGSKMLGAFIKWNNGVEKLVRFEDIPKHMIKNPFMEGVKHVDAHLIKRFSFYEVD